MNREMFTAVCDRLENKVAQLRWIDAEMGQLSSPGMRPPVAFPCALVEISYTSCDTLSGGTQKVEAEIQVRVGFDVPGPTNTGVPEKLREKALEYMDILDEVHRALQWWDGDRRFNPLRRTRAVPERNSGGRKTYLLTYRTAFVE